MIQKAEINGAELTYEMIGQGPPILMLHGFGLDRRMWKPQLDALSNKYTVVVCDMPGFGLSQDPVSVNSLTSADMLSLVSHLGFFRTHVCGLSYGGAVALEMALQAPETIASLTLVSAVLGGHHRSQSCIDDLLRSQAQAKHGDLRGAQQTWIENPLFQQISQQPSSKAAIVEMVETYRGWHWLHGAKCLNMKAINHLDQIKVPTLAMVGQLDLIDFHQMAECLADGIDQVELMRFDSNGHMINMEAPETFNNALLGFLENHPLYEVD